MPLDKTTPPQTLEQALRELERANHIIRRLERENRIMAENGGNADPSRCGGEADGMLQSLYDGLLLEHSPDMLFLFDEKLRLVQCSRAGMPILGTADRTRLKGTPFRQVFSPLLEQDWVDKVYSQSRSALEARGSSDYEDAVRLPDGRTLHVRITITPLVDHADNCRGLILSLRDITELALVRQQAEESSRSKSNFLANMSHEIRTPMNAIKGLSELLALTELNNVQRNYVHNIISSAKSLLGVINDVLDFSKIDANKAELIEGPYSLGDLIAEISNVVSLRASEKGLMLLTEISPSLPRGLRGDDVRVKQILINILTNAVKYTPSGHVILRMYGEKKDGKIELVCAVEDTGVGIRKEEIPGLFEAFSRADLKANRDILGTGLGLSISRRLAENMGGSISVESEFGVGSTFTARIPQGIVDPLPLAAVENPGEKRVLLLEDSVRARITARMLDELMVSHTAVSSLEQLDHTGTAYTHCIFDDSFPEQGIRRLRSQSPGCVFIALKDMRYAMGQPDIGDATLFAPLLITELAKALALEPGQYNRGLRSADKDIDDFALEDAHILVVDDNGINLMVSGEILRSYKAEVTCAESGRAALQLCEKEQFDLIFMDHMMPEMDGVETTQHLRRQDGPNQTVPIVALTANVVNGVRNYYLQCGMNDFIGKPIEISELGKVLLRWLPQHKIVSMEKALQPGAPNDGRGQAATMENLIQSLDAFGMYVSDVMREISGNTGIYIERMERILTELGPLVQKLREEVAAGDWDRFAGDIGNMGKMIHDVGARDCAGRARKLANAAKERNVNYIRGDFYSLMDNMYMLEKKMEVAVPLAKGESRPDVPFGDVAFCYSCLTEMRDTLLHRDMDNTNRLMESLAHYSLDHDLDMILNAIRAKLAERDFEGALPLHDQALHRCTQSMERK